MAVVTVAIQSTTRESSASTASDGGTWSSIGGGVNLVVDTDIAHQGGISLTSKVSSKTDAGHDFVRTTTASVADRVWLLKIINTNYGAISGNGIRLSLGNSNTVNYEWQVIPAATDYPLAGGLGINKLGWWIFPIDENSTIDRTTSGSPAFGTWDYYRNIITNNASAKAENLGSDAIDHCSATDGGLLLNGGDTAPAGNFADFVFFDDTTTANRYGFAFDYQGKNFAVGTWRIGNATLTEFTSSGESVTWINSRTPGGFNRIHIDLQTSGTVVDIDLGSLDSVGAATWAAGAISTDTRTDFFVENTTGTLSMTGTLVKNFRNVTLTSAVTLSGCTLGLYDITMSTADVTDSTITTTAIDGTAACNDISLTDQTDITWVKGPRVPTTTDPGTGHALEIISTGAKTFTDLIFTDYDAVSTFDTITGVDDALEVIDTVALHGLDTGQRVYYNKDGGTDAIGLTAHTTAYYVNVISTSTLSLHTTLADAVADTSRVDLTDGSGGETHWLEPGAAAVYNSSGGSVTISVVGGTGPSVRNSSGSTTTVTVSVPISITGVTEGTRCSMIGDGGAEDGVELLAGYANSSGVFSGGFGGTTPQLVKVRTRNSGIVNAAIQDDGAVFTDYTDEAREQVGADDVVPLPAVPVAADAFYVGGLAKFGEVLMNVTTGGATYIGTWEYWNGAWVSLTNTDGTSSMQTTGWNKVEFTAPSDWATSTENTQGPFYYIRFRVTTGGGTGPSAEYITLNKTDKYLPFNGSGTIAASSGLTASAVWILDTIAS